jgi:hypothetical protein
VNIWLRLSPGPINPVSNEPASAVAVCETDARLIHVTVSPALIVIVGGMNMKLSIVTILEAVGYNVVVVGYNVVVVGYRDVVVGYRAALGM